jgi:hypothetical protein
VLNESLNKYKYIYKTHRLLTYKILLTVVKTFPVSTAECERSFSGINLCMLPHHASLQIDHVSTLLFIRLVGLSLSKFNPDKYVKTAYEWQNKC